MEDYEKKYKEALEKANSALKDGGISSNTIAYIQSVFPELKKSEDERIRKEIITFIATTPKQRNSHSKWIAWLEKQCEKSSWRPSEEQYKALDYAFNSIPDTELGNYYEGVLLTLIEDLHRLEKQGEKKPVIEGTFVNVDEAREDFMQEVYRVLNADPTNDRANQIIDAFDHLPTIIIQKPADKIQLGKKYKCIASPRYSTFMIGEIYKPEDEFLCSLMNFCYDCFEPIEDGEQKPIFNAEHWYKHCWSCAKSHICEKYNPNKKACKEHRFANGIRSEQIKQKK